MRNLGSTLGNRICGTGLSVHSGVKIIRLPVLFELKSRPLIRGLTKKIEELEPDLLMIHGTDLSPYINVLYFLKKLSCSKFADNYMIVDVVQKAFSIYLLFFSQLFYEEFFVKKN